MPTIPSAPTMAIIRKPEKKSFALYNLPSFPLWPRSFFSCSSLADLPSEERSKYFNLKNNADKVDEKSVLKLMAFKRKGYLNG